MSIAVVTGSGGLVGLEATRRFCELGFKVVGIENNMRGYFFGDDGSTEWATDELRRTLGAQYEHHHLDIRDRPALEGLFEHYGTAIEVVVHVAGQPSHDWAAREPITDFDVNATGTLNVLENTRRYSPDAAVVFTSTNKVYGDTPNSLPLVEEDTRWEIDPSHTFAGGVPESMSIDQCLHSLFGAGKVAADVLAQEYGRYFGLKVGVFRCGAITGAGHSAAELHGFLAYLMRCAMENRIFTIYGYQGKQVRDTIHARDLVAAFEAFVQDPRPGAVYNMGGGRDANCSLLEAIQVAEELTGRPMRTAYEAEARRGDHIWWISDTSKFKADFPGWRIRFDVVAILEEMLERNHARWQGNQVG